MCCSLSLRTLYLTILLWMLLLLCISTTPVLSSKYDRVVVSIKKGSEEQFLHPSGADADYITLELSKLEEQAAEVQDSDADYLAICVVVKDQHRDLREWIEHHQLVGVGKFYIFDHSGSIPARAAIEDYIDYDVVTYHFVTDDDYSHMYRTVQMYVYNRCLQDFGRAHQWMAMIEADEFLVSHQREMTIPALLREYEQDVALAVNWVVFGSSGHETRPKGGVLRNYVKCFPWDHDQHKEIKTIVNSKYFLENVDIKLNKVGEQIIWKAWKNPHSLYQPPGTPSFVVDELHRPVEGGLTQSPTHKRIALYQYPLKSRADFQERLDRNAADTDLRKKALEYFAAVDALSTEHCMFLANRPTIYTIFASKEDAMVLKENAVSNIKEKETEVRPVQKAGNEGEASSNEELKNDIIGPDSEYGGPFEEPKAIPNRPRDKTTQRADNQPLTTSKNKSKAARNSDDHPLLKRTKKPKAAPADDDDHPLWKKIGNPEAAPADDDEHPQVQRRSKPWEDPTGEDDHLLLFKAKPKAASMEDDDHPLLVKAKPKVAPTEDDDHPLLVQAKPKVALTEDDDHPLLQRKTKPRSSSTEDDDHPLLQRKTKPRESSTEDDDHPLLQRETKPRANPTEDDDHPLQRKTKPRAARTQDDHPLLQRKAEDWKSRRSDVHPLLLTKRTRHKKVRSGEDESVPQANQQGGQASVDDDHASLNPWA